MVRPPEPTTVYALTGRADNSEQLLAYARACWPAGGPVEQRLIARQLAVLIAIDDVLDARDPLPDLPTLRRVLLPWATETSGGRLAPIGEALAEVEHELAAIVHQRSPDAGEDGLAWWRAEAERTLAAAWQERRWRDQAAQPDESTYLDVAEVSIGVMWVAASLLLLEGAPVAHAGGPAQRAIAAVAAATRVANDLSDTRREQQEGKLQLLLMRARAIEQATDHSPAQALRLARQQLRSVLLERVAAAGAALTSQVWADSPRARQGLSGLLGVALTQAGWRPRA